tara:strand:+ start:6481 stop:6666 length:186 start_codon:yes stop_codon:yes gene_type:complete
MEFQNRPVERLVMKSYQSQSKQINEHNRIIFIIPKQKKQIEFYRKNKLKMKMNVSKKKIDI